MRLLAPLMLLACPAPDDPGSDLPAATGDGLFLHGCPVPGRAAARQLTDAAERPTGPDALAAPGDVVLLNAHAAFVIQDPATPRTYYHYGGIPIDAVAVDGCSQAAPETFGELGFVIGQLDLLDFTASNLRMFRGDRMEIVSDGADGGPAVVDVHGTDDRFWLVELDLIRQAFRAGKVKHLPDPWRLDVTVRYTLDPEATALGVEVRLDPGDGPGGGFLTGALLFPSDLTQPVSWSDMPYSLGGLGLDTQVPWLGLDGPTSYAVAMPGSTMGRTEVSGCTALVALDQAWDALVAGSG
ncbi:MAG TPA: hypothetical protein PKA64_23010, partial [Myxococcota bacterium]|nr:hypothetical protein [Myxococcota bacterium]